MPQVNRFSRLPVYVQREVERRLVENGFSDYTAIADDLKSRGYRISRSALHRAGQELKQRYKSLRDEHLTRLSQFDEGGISS